MINKHPPVAQLDRVSGYEPEGQEFESLQAGQSEIEFRRGYYYPKGTFDLTIEDVLPPMPGDADYVDQENGQCCCGEYNCAEEYVHWTSGY